MEKGKTDPAIGKSPEEYPAIGSARGSSSSSRVPPPAAVPPTGEGQGYEIGHLPDCAVNRKGPKDVCTCGGEHYDVSTMRSDRDSWRRVAERLQRELTAALAHADGGPASAPAHDDRSQGVRARLSLRTDEGRRGDYARETWLVTGGSGSFGRAFIRTVLADRPDVRLISLSRNAEMRYRLEAEAGCDRLAVVPGDVRQPSDLLPHFRAGVDVVISAAAEKHVPTGQKYSSYTRSVNVEGTENLLNLAQAYHVPRFLALSTDKACAPVNFYGESKADAERLVVGAATRSGSQFAVVRYGNVVGSSGSVIPLFIRQRAGKRLTVTDRRMTRYWMPLADDAASEFAVVQEPGRQPVLSAVRFVLLALEHMQGGEIFIPRIPSGSVLDLAAAIGGADCQIEDIGIRDGEKLHEQLVSVDEGTRCWITPWGAYALLPTAASEPPAFGWTRVPAGFEYTSAQDVQRLNVEGLTPCG